MPRLPEDRIPAHLHERRSSDQLNFERKPKLDSGLRFDRTDESRTNFRTERNRTCKPALTLALNLAVTLLLALTLTLANAENVLDGREKTPCLLSTYTRDQKRHQRTETRPHPIFQDESDVTLQK